MAPPPDVPADPTGAATLERLARATRFNRWMFDRIRPWIGRRVLEVGAGLGNLSAFLLDRERVVLTDTDPGYLERLRQRFGAHPNVTIARLELPRVHDGLAAERFDTIICLNVLEHIADDHASLVQMRRLLRPGREGAGRLVLLVPALRALYGTLDEALGHYRRYGRADLTAKLRAAGFAPHHLEYFNLAGMPGWWLVGRVLRRRLIPAASLAWYDALVPLFRLERLLPWRVGQSLIAIGEAPA
ncbi:MAG: class I SAM-dependent methyltransferase [Gemmatimonadales bacterium]